MRNYEAATFYVPFLIILFILAACKQTPKQNVSAEQPFEVSPVFTPQESLSKMVIEEGFKIEYVASEPLIVSPVAMNFDEKGRMWVVEMRGYMPDVYGLGENARNGNIAILEDKDKDGVMDTRKVFLNSRVLSRSICLIENGILVVEPPRLWYYEIIRTCRCKWCWLIALIHYAADPLHLNIAFEKDGTIEPLSIITDGMNEEQLEDEADKVASQRQFMRIRKKVQQLRLGLFGVYIGHQTLWLKLHVRNYSNVNYQLGYVRIILRDIHLKRRCALPEGNISSDKMKAGIIPNRQGPATGFVYFRHIK